MPPGKIKSFRREQGFGVVALDDGRELPFDYTACHDFAPEDGHPVEVTVGVARLGGEKAVALLSTQPKPPKPLSVRQAVKGLQKEGLAVGLTPALLKKIVAEVFDGEIEDAKIVDVLDTYYTDDAARAAEDAYVRHDWRYGQETDDVMRELATIAGVAVSAGARAVQSLDDVVRLFNTALADSAAEKRFYALATEGDWHAYFALPRDKAKRLADARVLTFEEL